MATGKKTGGRQKGTPNKLSAEVKVALHDAFGKVGGVKALVAWGKEHPGEFYKLWVKLLPTEITGKDGGPVQLVKVIDLSGESAESA
jgi:hypothetical protein